MAMIHISIPEEFSDALGMKNADNKNFERWSLEALTIEAYREGLISRGKLGEILGLEFYAREAWLKEKRISYDFSSTELDQDREELEAFFGK